MTKTALAVLSLVSLVGLTAGCSDETGASPPRAASDAAAAPPTDAAAGGSAPRDAGSGSTDADAAIAHPDPLAGTSKTAKLIKGGFGFTEGPLWIGGRLLFSDITNNVIQELLPDGGTTPFRQNSGAANGNAIDAQGRLVTCEGGTQRVTRSAATAGAQRTAIATTYEGKMFNAPNDVIVRADGNIYFTDPKYGGGLSQDDEAVYRIDAGGTITRLAHDFAKPNGIALSPDGATLYVVDNGAGKLLRAAVDAAGSVSAFTVFADAPGGDGMAVDDAGNLYVTTSGGVLVLDAAGKELGTIAVPEVPANCSFGGTARRTLFITARKGLYSIDLNVPGLP